MKNFCGKTINSAEKLYFSSKEILLIDNNLRYLTLMLQTLHSTVFRVGRGSGDTPLLFNTEEYNDRCSGLEEGLEIHLSYTIQGCIMIGVYCSECQDPGLPSFSDSLQILCPVDPVHVLEMGMDRVPVVLDHLRADVAFKRFGLGLTLIF